MSSEVGAAESALKTAAVKAFLLVLLGASLLGACLSPAAGQPAASLSSATEPKLDLSIFPADGKRVVTEPITIAVTVTNLTAKSVTARGMRICFAGDLANVRKVVDGAASLNPGCFAIPTVAVSADSQASEEIPIPSGRQAHYSLYLPKLSTTLFSQWDFSRASYPYQLFFRYDTVDSDKTVQRIVQQSSTIEMRPPLRVPILGMVVGVVFSTLMLWLWGNGKLQQQWLYGESTGKSNGSNVSGWDFATGIAGGALTGLVVILLLNQSDGAQLPISVAVNDFLGGAMLGLISHRLTAWVVTSVLTTKPAA